MALNTWWRSDALPILSPLAGFDVRRAGDASVIAELSRIDRAEARARLQGGHHAYVATLHGQPVGYGWAATRAASIGELGLAFALPRDERYLWDFATLPAYRGLGVYPRLLQAILRSEASTRAWILHAPENQPSGAGMARAGFRPVGRLSFQPDGLVALGSVRDDMRAWWGASLFGVEVTEAETSSCWCCARGEASCGCWAPGTGSTGACACAIPLGVARKSAA